MSSLLHAKENNYSQFARLIESMEDRFMHVDSDDVIDINSLQVVRTRSGRVSKPRITPKPTSAVKSKRGRKPGSGTSRKSSRASFPSSSIDHTHDSSGFESASFDSLQSSTCEPESSRIRSILFDRPAQLEASKNLLSILELGGPLKSKTASNLYERFKVTLGRDELPNKATVRPFFTFHEDHDIGVTLLFDTPDLTPWTLICLKFFGKENLGLYQQIYRHVLTESTVNTRKMITTTTSTPQPRPPVNPPRPALLAVALRRSRRSKQNNLETPPGLQKSPSINQTPSNKSSPSQPAMSSVYTSTTSTPIYHPPIDSIVYENDKQLSSLRKLAEILRQNDEESKQVKRKLVARAAKALGFESMPYGENVYPFFTFHEKGEIAVSFLFNIQTLSPWATICNLYFGDEMINICKDIYRMMNSTHNESLERLEQLAVSYRQLSTPQRALRAETDDSNSEP